MKLPRSATTSRPVITGSPPVEIKTCHLSYNTGLMLRPHPLLSSPLSSSHCRIIASREFFYTLLVLNHIIRSLYTTVECKGEDVVNIPKHKHNEIAIINNEGKSQRKERRIYRYDDRNIFKTFRLFFSCYKWEGSGRGSWAEFPGLARRQHRNVIGWVNDKNRMRSRLYGVLNYVRMDGEEKDESIGKMRRGFKLED